jgi:preprotein translocase subunit SecB
MEVNQQVKLNFKGIDITNVQFASHKHAVNGSKIDLVVKSKVVYPKNEPNNFKIVMLVNVSIPEYFTLNIEAVGNFELDGSIGEDTKKTFVNINAPAIVFPYVRSFISTFTANLGESTGLITIPPHFFKGNITEEF